MRAMWPAAGAMDPGAAGAMGMAGGSSSSTAQPVSSNLPLAILKKAIMPKANALASFEAGRSQVKSGSKKT